MTATPSRRRLFLVDDDDNVLRSLRIVLRRLYDVTCFSNADDALRQSILNPPDVVVTDIKMPTHDGFWLLRELRSNQIVSPVIFNSAFQDVMSADEVQGAVRPFGILPKNGSLDAFLDMVSLALSQPS